MRSWILSSVLSEKTVLAVEELLFVPGALDLDVVQAVVAGVEAPALVDVERQLDARERRSQFPIDQRNTHKHEMVSLDQRESSSNEQHDGCLLQR